MFKEPNGVLVLANKIQGALRFKSKGAKPAAQIPSQGEVVVRADKTKRSYASCLRVTSSVVADAVFVITYESLKFELVVEKRSLKPLSFPLPPLSLSLTFAVVSDQLLGPEPWSKLFTLSQSRESKGARFSVLKARFPTQSPQFV